MTDFLTELLKFFQTPTRSKLVVGFAVVFVALCGFAIYEHYTASFRLDRLQKEANLVAHLQEIEIRGTNDPPELRQLESSLLTQTQRIISEEPTLFFTPPKITLSLELLWKFLAGAAVWWAIGLADILTNKRLKQIPTTKVVIKTVVLMYFLLGLLCGFVGLFVPKIWWPWFHIFIYPWIFVALLLVALLPIVLLSSAMSAAKDKAQAIKCISNLRQIGLAARMWANENANVLPRSFASMKAQLGEGQVMHCPAGNAAAYEILSPGASTTDPAIVYAWCPIHKHVILADGSVQPLGALKLTQDDGKWKIQ